MEVYGWGWLLWKLLFDTNVYTYIIDMLVDIKKDINHGHSFNSSQENPVDEHQLPAELESDHKPKRSVPSLEPIIALVVIACNRPNYIRQTLDTLLK